MQHQLMGESNLTYFTETQLTDIHTQNRHKVRNYVIHATIHLHVELHEGVVLMVYSR